MAIAMTLDWVPLSRIGPFVFGSSVKQYVDEYDLLFLPDEDDPSVGWDVYAVANVDMRVYAENGKVVSVLCDEVCMLHGRNLIGLSFDNARAVIGSEPSDKPDTAHFDDGIYDIFEFISIEGQVWVKDAKVVTVICSEYCDD